MPVTNYQRLVNECEAAIRAGQAEDVAKRLAGLNSLRVPREWRLPLANVCRRAGLLPLGMKLLARVVYPKQRNSTPPTDLELAEYAVLLTRAGAHKEALEVLERVDTTVAPEALLYRSYARFHEYDFDNAIVSLEAYLKAPLTPYSQLLGRVNLAYAYVANRMDRQALELLLENIEIAARGQHTRLQINCWELLVRLHVQSGQLAEALSCLGEATRLIGSAQTSETHLVEKWRALLDGLATRSVEPALAYRQMAQARGDWENVREIDRYALKVDFDRARFLFLTFGTPHQEFRRRLFDETREQPEASEYVFGPADAPCLDVLTGELNGVATLDRGRKSHQLIEVLMRDFYRPLKLGELFVELFPDEHFDIFSSPNRVHQILFRTREWISQRGFPLLIDETDGYYSIKTTGAFAFRVPLQRGAVSIYDGLYRELCREFAPGQEFQARDVQARLNMPRTTFFRFSSWALQAGHIERTGASAATRYRRRAA